MKLSEKSSKRFETIINITYVGLILLIAVLVFRYAIGLVMPFLIAFLIVSLMNPLISGLKKVIKTQREVVSFLVMLVLFAGIGTGAFFLIMNLVFWLRDQLTALSGFYDTSLAPSMAQMWNNISTFVDQLPADWQVQFQSVQDAFMQGIQSFLLSLSQKGLAAISGFTGGIPGFFVAFIFTIMLSFFISMQYDAVVGFIRSQLPPGVRGTVGELKQIFKETILRYISAYIKLMSVTFIELLAGLLVLRTQNAILIALGIAVFDALPVFGTGAIMIPWVLTEVIKGNFAYALGLGVLYAIVTVVRNIIEPKIVGDTLGLNPIVSLTSIYFGFKLFGVFGMILMPIATQVVLELNRRGKITILRRKDSKKNGG